MAFENGALLNVKVSVRDADREVTERVAGNIDASRQQAIPLHCRERAIPYRGSGFGPVAVT
jgi:hypothetical protein